MVEMHALSPTPLTGVMVIPKAALEPLSHRPVSSFEFTITWMSGSPLPLRWAKSHSWGSPPESPGPTL